AWRIPNGAGYVSPAMYHRFKVSGVYRASGTVQGPGSVGEGSTARRVFQLLRNFRQTEATQTAMTLITNASGHPIATSIPARVDRQRNKLRRTVLGRDPLSLDPRVVAVGVSPLSPVDALQKVSHFRALELPVSGVVILQIVRVEPHAGFQRFRLIFDIIDPAPDAL